ncbi:MAG: DUF3999 domain-containing protein [Betaproteobacteria bacterium]
MKGLRVLAPAWLLGAASLVAPGLGNALTPTPTGAGSITLDGAGPYYQLTLPAAIYGHAAYPDLRDLRVRNAAGQAVPFAWLRRDVAVAQTESRDVPIFPIQGATAASVQPEGVLAFVVRSDGSLAALKTGTSVQSDVTAWLLDVSKVQGRLLQARFTVSPDTQGVFAMRLEASDDLQRWRSLGGEEQLISLTRSGQAIERMAVDLGGIRARFLRLRWSHPRRGAVLTGVGIDSVQDALPVAALEWSEPLRAQSCATDYCDYVLPRGWPANGLRIHLAEPNTLAPVRVSGVLESGPALARPERVVRNPLYALRHQQLAAIGNATPQEVSLLDTVVYRLTQDTGEALSPNLSLDGGVYPRLRLRTRGPVTALGVSAPTLEVSTVLQTLLFLAQGQGPFLLSVELPVDTAGAPPALPAGGALPLSALLPGYRVDQPMPLANMSEARAKLAEPAAQTASAMLPDAKSATSAAGLGRKFWLWSALVLGLLALGAMAWSLFKSLKQETHSS